MQAKATRGADELRDLLGRLDGRGYKAYKELTGHWDLGTFVLAIDHVQGDPFATPSRLSVSLHPDETGLPSGAYTSASRALGTAALIARRFADEAHKASRSLGSGRSGEIRMEHPGQVVLPQTAVQVTPDGSVEARFVVGLPARGRRIAGAAAEQILLDVVPSIVRDVLLAGAHDEEEIERCAATNEDADALRSELTPRGLVAFVAEGAHLPRRSGVDDRPLEGVEGEEVVPFESPEAMRVEIELPNRGRVVGMGVPEGVTLIVGGGFHGKSTLLRAIQDGVWNHFPGDGRELAVTRADAVKIRAEDGRSVTGVDISPFIDGLPLGRDTHAFSTPNASGSTSQAAAIVEALEAGAGVLLVDEDTSATNFMIRDRRMQELVPKGGEPITPFVDRVRDLFESLGVSTVLVLGGSGDYLDVADHVVRLDSYRPEDVTQEATAVAARLPTGRTKESSESLDRPRSRRVRRSSIDPRRGSRAVNVKVPDHRTLVFGTDTIDLVAVEQLAGRSQIKTVGLALAWAASRRDGDPTVADLLGEVEGALAAGLDTFDEWRVGDLMAFRRFEVAAALNRLRSLRVV